jgi:hypothetical protein
MSKQDAAKKIVKLLNLKNNFASSNGEKVAASERINDLCKKWNLRIDGVNIIDVDIERENEKKKFDQLHNVKPTLQHSIIDVEKTNEYVYFKGKKYYKRKGQRAPVPRHLYTNRDYFLN